MELKDRVNRIKKLLEYCKDNSLEYYREKEYFTKFFHERDGFPTPFTGKVKISLKYGYIIITYEAKSYGLSVYEDVDVLFTETSNEVLNSFVDKSKYDGFLAWSDIDEKVWEDIEKLAEIRANENVQNELIAATKEYNKAIKKHEDLLKIIEKK